jgi:hypothetical protein
MARDVAARGSHFSGPDSAQHTMTTLFSSSSHENSTDLSHANRQHPAPQSLPWRGKMGDKGDRGSSGGCKADCCAIGAPRDASPYGNQAVLQACKWEKAAVPTQHQLENNSVLRSREMVCRIAFFDDSFWFVLAVSAIGDAGPFVQLGVLNGI